MVKECSAFTQYRIKLQRISERENASYNSDTTVTAGFLNRVVVLSGETGKKSSN